MTGVGMALYFSTSFLSFCCLSRQVPPHMAHHGAVLSQFAVDLVASPASSNIVLLLV